MGEVSPRFHCKHIPYSETFFFLLLPKTQCGKVTDCFGTRSKRMRFSSWSSSSITAASGYICSMSKWNWTPAGGSRRKFLLSWRQGEHQSCENRQGSQEEQQQLICGTLCDCYLLLTKPESVAGSFPLRCNPPREALPLLRTCRNIPHH